ncbi:MAG: hypothetical protein J4432_02780 [DPANN group archaeon]|nr:hypothetical protein [DPANN group archaeon]
MKGKPRKNRETYKRQPFSAGKPARQKSVDSLRERAFKKTKERIQKKLEQRDKTIVQTVKSIDLIDKTSNLLTEQLREWYANYFPELSRHVEDADEYLVLITKLKSKANFTKEKIEQVVGNKGYADKIEKACRETMGGTLKDTDLDQIVMYAESIISLREQRTRTLEYLETVMKEEAPNITHLIGAPIAARLISIAGSLEKLSEFPSSTIQVLGAEKALFAHIRQGTPSPKHGVIFGFPKLRGANKNVRGKIARKLSSKISIAAKVDYFKGAFYADKLSKELENEIKELIK